MSVETRIERRPATRGRPARRISLRGKPLDVGSTDPKAIALELRVAKRARKVAEMERKVGRR
jgi:hypothetical protein